MRKLFSDYGELFGLSDGCTLRVMENYSNQYSIRFAVNYRGIEVWDRYFVADFYESGHLRALWCGLQTSVGQPTIEPTLAPDQLAQRVAEHGEHFGLRLYIAPSPTLRFSCAIASSPRTESS